MTFRISAVPYTPFAPLFDHGLRELARRRAMLIEATDNPAFPAASAWRTRSSGKG